MKELQKYECHAITRSDPRVDGVVSLPVDVYLASEADAAFAEMRRENEGLRKQVSDFMAIERQMISDSEAAKLEYKRDADMLIAKHAEEIERLKAELESTRDYANEQMDIVGAENDQLRLQAERYEKLKRCNFEVFANFYASESAPDDFDALVDQLPASGEASAEVQASRTE